MCRLAGLIFLFVFTMQVSAAGKEPLDVVQEATGSVIEQLREIPEIRSDSKKLNDVIETLLLPHIDFNGLSRLALGKYWRRATEIQKSRFELAFRQLLIRTYAAVLRRYTEQRIEYFPFKPSDKAGRATVSSRIVDVAGSVLLVEYKLRMLDGAWKIYDMSVEGVSLALNYRTTFASEIEVKGVDGLIESLVAKNSKGCISSQSSTINC